MSEAGPPRKKGLLLKVLVFFLAPAVVILAILFYLDEAPPADDDLSIATVAVPDAENGYRAFALAYQEALAKRNEAMALEESDAERDESSGPLIPFHQGWDRQRAAAIVKRDAALIEALELGLTFPHFQVETEPPDSNGKRGGSQGNQGVHALSLRAALRFEEGREPAAFRDALRSIRFGRRFFEDEGGGIRGPILVASTVNRHLREGIEWSLSFLLRSELPDADLETIVRDLERQSISDEIWEASFRRSYRETCRLLDNLGVGLASASGKRKRGGRGSLLPGEARSQFLFKPNQTRRLFAELYRRIINEVGRDPSLPPDTFADLKPKGRFKSLWPFNNVLGKTLFLGFAEFHLRPLDAIRTHRFALECPRTILAVRRYHRDLGELPPSLDELVPKYLKAVPRDPYDGAPIRYSREQGTIHSVGKDRRDAGGLALEEDSDFDFRKIEEPTVRIFRGS